MRGFFDISTLTAARSVPTVPRCGLCGLYKTCCTPRMKPTGKGGREILVVAEAPGEHEDRIGKQLVGDAGQVLRDILKDLGYSLDRDCWKTNAIICRPPRNATPTDEQITACRPNLMETIKTLKPKVIILMGQTAVKSLIPVVWKDSVGNSLTRWVGWNIPCQKLNRWICPTYHPSYLLRSKNEVLEMMMTAHLKKAFRHTTQPYHEVPNYREEVELVYSPHQAAKIIRGMIKAGKPVVPDFETNCIKPEEEGSRIVCCSLCQSGERTIAYPWKGEAVEATADLLQSDVPKLGANIKFEDRWTRRKLGVVVRGWKWDTMVASHVLDNRPLITSVKFQSFVRLGLEGYDVHIRPLLECVRGSRLNRIQEIEMPTLLTYCGIDSRVEWDIAMSQMREMKRIEGTMS